MKHPKPEPVVVVTLCSLCNEPWAAHGDDPTSIDCIRLLRARIARTPHTTFINRPYVAPQPYVVPLPATPWWQQGTWSCSSGTATTSNVTYLTPRTDDGPEGAVA